MRKTRGLGTFALIVVAVGLPVATARAQRERDDSGVRRRCEEAGRIARRGPSHPDYDGALTRLGRCEVSGPESLAALWHRPPADTVVLGRLEFQTQEVRDVRLLRAVLRVFQGTDQAPAARLAALRVLVFYYETGSSLPRGALSVGYDPKYCVLGSYTDFVTRDGAQPIGAQDRPAILAAVSEVGAADPDALVRHAAACTAAAMAL